MTHLDLSSPGRTAAVVVVVLLVSARPALGQAVIPGLRAPGATTQTGQSLVLDLSGAMGRDVLRTANAADVVQLDRDVAASSISGSVAYGLSLSWLNGRVHAASAGRRFSGAGGNRDWSFISYGGADLGLSRQLSGRTTLSARAGVSYQPISATTLFPDLFRPGGAPPLPTEFDLASSLGTYLSSDLGVGISRALSRRSSLSADYSRQYRGAIVDGGAGQEIDTASVGYGHGLTRWLSLRLGYGYSTTGAFREMASSVDNHRIDLGVDLNKALSFSRRTTLSMTSGSVVTSDGRRSRFDIVGDVGLMHQFTSTATLDVGYSRRVDFVQTFALPTIADSISASFDATFGRAVLTTGVGASRGQVGLTSGSDFWATQSAVGTSFSLNRWLSIRTDYAYYRYRFSTSASLPIGIGARVRRHHFQIGAGLGLPLLGRSRRSNASR
jgi:hypothetical protein